MAMSSGGGSEILQLRLDVGHESVLLAEPRTTFPCAHTHRWTVFLRGHNESSLDPTLIQKVVFQLHDDFPNPKRVVSNQPFEISETGYGSFIIPIYILFAHSKREHYIEYDMNLKYASHDKNKETKIIEFKDPKPELRARLLRAGAEISTNKTPKVQNSGGTNSFQDLFGETIQLAVPSTSNDKSKLPAPLPSIKRQSASPSSNGSSMKVKPHNSGKAGKVIPAPSTSAVASQALSPQELDKKRRKSKDAGRSSISSKSGGKHASYAGLEADNHRSSHNLEVNGAAQCLLDASKLPPFVSPLNDGAYGGAAFPSTSSAGRDEQRHGDGAIDPGEYKIKKSSSKSRLKDGEKPKNLSSSAVRNAKRMQNGGTAEDKAKRKKTKSDSGLDSDYSSGMPNAHSPGVANGQNSVGAHDANGAGSALFSPPDSVRSVDTLQESPASAASSSSAASSASSGRQRRYNGCEDDHPGAATSSTNASSDQDRLRMLLVLQQKIMTIKEKEVAQRVADIISTHGSFELTSDCLEFDLYTLDSELVQRLLQLLKLQV